MSNNQDIELMFSSCCKKFVDFIDKKFICTGCGIMIRELGENDVLKYKQVLNASKNSMNSEIVTRNNRITKRLATDETYAPTTIECPVCQNYSRLLRDLDGKKICVCTECRNVFYPVEKADQP